MSHNQVEQTITNSPIKDQDIQFKKRIVALKIYLLTFLTVFSLILFNCYPPIRTALFNFGILLHSLGWAGPLLLVLLNGLIVIPLALPYPIFELTIAFLIPEFLYAMLVSMAGKLIGAFACFLLAKTLMKNKVRSHLVHFQKYRELEYMLEREPWKFSLIFRISILPLFIKNYGLALPKNIGAGLYMLCTLITTIPFTAFNLHLMRQAGSVHQFFDGTKSASQIVFSLGMVLLSVGLFIYIARYTKRILLDIKLDQPAQSQRSKVMEAESPVRSQLKSQGTTEYMFNKEDQTEKIEDDGDNDQEENGDDLIVVQ